MSSMFLNEKLTFFGWLGCALCIVRPVPRVVARQSLIPRQIGSSIIALNGKFAKWIVAVAR